MGKQCFQLIDVNVMVNKNRFIKKQETIGLLSSLILKTPFIKIPIPVLCFILMQI